MKRLGAAAAAAVLACGFSLPCGFPLAHAEDFSPNTGWEAGARWWGSRGKTQWSHDGHGADPSLGNPASVLVYDKLDAQSLEVFGGKRWHEGWSVSGSLGGGTIHHGMLSDSDYLAGQVKSSETNSSITDGDLAYATLDGGYDFWRPAWRTSLGALLGLSYWNERVVASGLSSVVPAGAPGLPNDVALITSDVKWYSIRLGLAGRAQIGDSLNLSATLAAVPYTRMRNDDSHWLRGDLGPTPNVTMDGHGYGAQLDAEARYTIFKSTDLGLGVRYWKLKTTTGNVQFGGGPSLPLNEFQSSRYGATVSLVTRW